MHIVKADIAQLCMACESSTCGKHMWIYELKLAVRSIGHVLDICGAHKCTLTKADFRFIFHTSTLQPAAFTSKHMQ